MRSGRRKILYCFQTSGKDLQLVQEIGVSFHDFAKIPLSRSSTNGASVQFSTKHIGGLSLIHQMDKATIPMIIIADAMILRTTYPSDRYLAPNTTPIKILISLAGAT